MAVSRTMDDLLAFAGTYVTTGSGTTATTNWVSDWGSDTEINKLLEKIKLAGDVTSADMTQMIALTGKANVQSQFVASLIQEYTSLMKSLLQKMS
ncbi:hypothetical protein [uncultured Hydrogenophaga sp.]|uniref:hypothetical protein n=1 Tax=uncultured Hydrogenophaga sp. TaxID=199683 RepID=UPI00265F70A2|nr:hypothetical protein [uncultured Hydrogenophaga sp.]